MPIQFRFKPLEPTRMEIRDWARYFNYYPQISEIADFLENYFLIERAANILNEMIVPKAAQIYYSFSQSYRAEIYSYLDSELKSYLIAPLTAAFAKDGALGKRAIK